MRHYGISEKLVKLLENTYRKSLSAVKVDDELTEWFKAIVPDRQDCSLSPYLSNLILEAVIRQALEDSTVEKTAVQLW